MGKEATQFKNGNKGKPKGAINKKTLILESFAKTIVEGGMEKFEQELHKLSGKEFVNAYMTLFEFVKPKLARTELTGKDGDPIEANIKWIGTNTTKPEATPSN